MTDNESPVEHVVGAMLSTLIECEYSAKAINAAFARFGYVRAAAPSSPPTEPPPGLLMSMAIRWDHGLGCPGYYDSPIYRPTGTESTHAQRLAATLRTMRQLWEEVTGQGFYKTPWPTDAAGIRDFIGPNCGSLHYGEPASERPSDRDIYEVSAHDLLSAFARWTNT